MRKRQPGFYVSVLAPPALGGKEVELLDGPWPTLDAAERRRAEIASSREGSQATPSIVEVAGDGVTVLRREAKDS